MHNVSAGVQAVELETYGGLVTLTRPENIPEGASPRNYDVDYLVGSVQTRAPLESVYSYGAASSGPNGGDAAVNAPLPPNVMAVNPWSGPANVLADNANYASARFLGIETVRATGALNVTEFAFNLPASVGPTGVTLFIKGFANSAVTVQARLLLNGVSAGTPKMVTLPLGTAGTVSLGAANDLWGTSLRYSDVNNSAFGVQISCSSTFAGAQAFLGYVTLQVGQTTANANFNFLTTFVAQDGSVKNLSLDADSNFWVEDVTNNPGVLTLAFDGVTGGAFANGVNGPGVEYLAFHDLTTGCDIPRQYTPQWTDRISQVGPGAAPVFAASSASSTQYPISTITQPAQQTRSFAFALQSTGPGSTQAGNTVTIYYNDSTEPGPYDPDLVAAFNSGYAVYLYLVMTNAETGFVTPDTVLVTSLGIGVPPGQSRAFYYFTYQVSTSQSLLSTGQGGYGLTYQRTLATMKTTVPVPQLTVGSKAVVAGNSVSAYNATWGITQTPKSGAMAITQTSLTGGVATYSYAVVSGANPVAGQLVTITNTLNADGTLNVVNTAILAVTGTNLGTFTVGGFSAVTDYPAEAEDGQATTAGTQFAFEPGLATLGSGTSPIYGTGTGGDIVVTGTGQFLAAGTKQGVVFFITRNGYYTAPSAPVTFTIPENSTAINVSQIPLGPPNVVARGIALTEAGANGVPGGNFFTLPTPVQYIVEGVTYTATSLFIEDNTSTTATLFVPDAELLNAEAIDIQGNNLFNLIELGNPGWVKSYAGRNFYGLCQNKIQNFTNLSFDGGYLPGTMPTPLGWTVPDAYGKLLVSPTFGNSYYIKNNSGAPLSAAGSISQTAFQDAYKQPILYPNTAYSVRVSARCPSGSQFGTLVVNLVADGMSYGTFSLPFAQLTTTMQTVTGTLLTSSFTTVPGTLLLEIAAQNIQSGADVEIDRIEIFPTAIPVLSTTVYGSYAGDLESVDGVTGGVQFTSENQQPVNGAVVMYDTFYGLKGQSLYSLQSADGLEPAQWNEPEVAQRAGACGINAYDFGEQWLVMACRNGLYLFDGGQPGKIMQEIYQIWNAIHWPAGKCIWVKNDVPNRRLLVGVPLPTPNFWLPDAPVNAAPTTPNVILMCNYQGCDSGEELKTEMALHTTMFGTLNATDMKRKWTLWQIAAPYAEIVSAGGLVEMTPEINILDGEVRFCNGIASSKIYRLKTDLPSNEIPTDDGVPIRSLYTSYGFVSQSKASQMPLLGMFRKVWTYVTHSISGVGTLMFRLLPNVLVGPTDATDGYYPWTLPGGFPLTDPNFQIHEAPLNFAATRTFVELSTTGRMDISDLVMVGRKHTHSPLTGKR